MSESHAEGGPSAESPQDLTLFVQNLLDQMVRPRDDLSLLFLEDTRFSCRFK